MQKFKDEATKNQAILEAYINENKKNNQVKFKILLIKLEV
jgi:hypothetical protein